MRAGGGAQGNTAVWFDFSFVTVTVPVGTSFACSQLFCRQASTNAREQVLRCCLVACPTMLRHNLIEVLLVRLLFKAEAPI